MTQTTGTQSLEADETKTAAVSTTSRKGKKARRKPEKTAESESERAAAETEKETEAVTETADGSAGTVHRRSDRTHNRTCYGEDHRSGNGSAGARKADRDTGGGSNYRSRRTGYRIPDRGTRTCAGAIYRTPDGETDRNSSTGAVHRTSDRSGCRTPDRSNLTRTGHRTYDRSAGTGHGSADRIGVRTAERIPPDRSNEYRRG